jgi:DMSO/TMAO reductase YedYZ molybdopterin-dependent catalytic subunit
MSPKDADRGRAWPWRGAPLTTRDIATIAVLAALGGVMSSYVGYLGSALNRLVGVPFGAGQAIAGLHVFWIVLAVVLTNRVGVGTSAGVLKGLVEMLAGSGKGALVVGLSLAAGLMVDLVWLASPRRGTVTTALAGGLGTVSNVALFAMFTSTYEGLLWLFAVLLVVSFASGLVFAGLLVTNVAITLEQAGVPVRSRAGTPPPAAAGARVRWGRTWTTWSRARVHGTVTVVAAVLFFAGAAVYYPMLLDNVAQAKEGTVVVDGAVGAPYSFELEDLGDQLVTVQAELEGDFTHEPPRNYTGVPLRAVLERAGPDRGASVVHVIGADGYGAQLDLPLADVMDGPNASAYILVRETGPLPLGGTGEYYRLVCRDLDGGWWVRWVVRIDVL